MVEARQQRQFDHPASAVWAVLEDFGNLEWTHGVERIELIGEGIGMIRRLHMPGMEPIDEQLTAMDGDAMWFSYVIPRGIPLPVNNYSAEAQVVALDDRRCEVRWLGRAEPNGIADEEAIKAIVGTYDMLFDWLGAHLEQAS